VVFGYYGTLIDRLLSTWAALEVTLNLDKSIDCSLEDKALYFRIILAIITSTPPRLLVVTCRYIDFLMVIVKASNSDSRSDLLNIYLYSVLRRLKTVRLTLFYIGLDAGNLPLDALLISLAQY